MTTWLMCRECAVFPSAGRRTRKATHVAFFVSGEASLVCAQHFAGAVRGGGFGWRVPKDIEADDSITRDELVTQQQVASVARRATPIFLKTDDVRRAVLDVLQTVVSPRGVPPPVIEIKTGREVALPTRPSSSDEPPNESECT